MNKFPTKNSTANKKLKFGNRFKEMTSPFTLKLNFVPVLKLIYIYCTIQEHIDITVMTFFSVLRIRKDLFRIQIQL